MLHEQVLDPLFPGCPIRNVLSRIIGKWQILILLTLNDKTSPMRFKEIAAAVPDISQRMLTVTLRDLETFKLIHRENYAEIPPRVEYSLTERGKSLMPNIQQLVNWTVDNFIEDERVVIE